MIKTNQSIRLKETAKGLRAVGTNPIRGKATSGVAKASFGSERVKEEAMYGGGSMMGGARNGITTNVLPQSGILYDTMLNNLIGENEMTNVRFYRDIYHYDAVAGSMVDMMSNMPFSDFTLLGSKDERLEVYEAAISQLDFKTFLPEATVDYLVTGMHTSTLVYNSDQKSFVDYIPWRMEDCRVFHHPLRGVDPVIKVRPPEYYRELLDGEVGERVKSEMSAKMIDAFSSDMIKLNPLNTLYLPRRTYTYSQHGTSIYRRILPLYFLEKTLYRGTLVEFMRRQRALLHVAVGDDIWEASPEEIQAVVALFMEGDMDPLGAVIGTRAGININEVRQPGDFLKYLDIIDQTSALKMKALGIGEGFLSGDASYASQEVNLTVFTENLRGFRDMITWKIFMSKLFPLIASLNDFRKDSKDKSNAAQRRAEHAAMRWQREMAGSKYNIDLQHKLNDSTKWDIPTVHWSKPLRPQADQQTLDMLGLLKEKGLPIPLTMFAAAGGLSMDNLLRDMKEDEEYKKKIKQITGKTPEELAAEAQALGMGGEMGLMGTAGDTGMGGRDDDGMGDARRDRIDEEAALRHLLKRGRRPLLSREFAHEYTGVTRTGKTKHIYRQNIERDRQFDNLVKAVKNVADPNNYSKALASAMERLGGIPNIYTE